MQHLAAGLILGAVLWELGPEMNRDTHGEKQAVSLGFILGFGILMFMSRFNLKINCHYTFLGSKIIGEEIDYSTCSSHISKEDEDLDGTTEKSLHGNSSAFSSEQGSNGSRGGSNVESGWHPSPTKSPLSVKNVDANEDDSHRHGAVLPSSPHLSLQDHDKVDKDIYDGGKLPIGLISAVWVNGAIDGLLIGIAFVSSGTAGLITAIALGIEQGLLGITTTKSLSRSFTTFSTFAISVLLVIPIPIFGLIAGIYLNTLPPELFACINAFGLSGLLYLVTEELLIEAHEDPETDKWYVSYHTFLGFAIVVVLHEFLH